MAACPAAVFATPVYSHVPLTHGKNATATKAENHTTNRVAAFGRGTRRKISTAHRQITLPSIRESSNRSERTSAIVLRLALIDFAILPFPAIHAYAPVPRHRYCFLPEYSAAGVHGSFRKIG